jgi:hypothetical protein
MMQRAQEVGPRHSINEAGEQSEESRCGDVCGGRS